MARYIELESITSSLHRQDSIYKPTPFWDSASKRITAQIQDHGLDRFRRLPICLSYFVPTYGPPTIGITSEQAKWIQAEFAREQPDSHKAQLALEAYLTGKVNALSDYRVLSASLPQPDLFGLADFSESMIGDPIEQFVIEGKRFSRSSLNYLLGLSLLSRHADVSHIKTVMEIGGGFGTLGEILGKSTSQKFKYIDIDIPPTSFVADFYLASIFGRENVYSWLGLEERDKIDVSELPDHSVLCSWQIEKLVGKVDLFVNYISFQEMEPEVVLNYFNQVRRLSPQWIILRNMREGKQRMSNTRNGVVKPIVSEDYVGMLGDFNLVVRSVIPFGYKTVDDFNSEILIFERK